MTKIENAARSYPAPTEELQKGLSKLVFGRIQELYNQLSGLVGSDNASEMLEHLQAAEEKHGVTQRSD